MSANAAMGGVSCDVTDATIIPVKNATCAATHAATNAATRAATSAATDAATRAATNAATYAATMDAIDLVSESSAP